MIEKLDSNSEVFGYIAVVEKHNLDIDLEVTCCIARAGSQRQGFCVINRKFSAGISEGPL